MASFTTIHSKMGEAADGASKVNNGTVKLADAITQLDGTATVNDGAVKLKDGTFSADGQSQLLDGQQLAEGAAKLADGVSTLILCREADSGAIEACRWCFEFEGWFVDSGFGCGVCF